jgi:trigger factor
VKVTTEKPEPGVAMLTVEVPAEDVDRAVDSAWRRVANRVNIPGFRRGKAPRPLVERHAGAAAIDEEALRRLLPERYDAAVDETGISPIDRPAFDIVQMERGKPLIFKATVPLRPTVEPGDYSAITIEQETVTVTDEQVDRTLDSLRENQAQWLPVEDRGVEMGDMVIADIKIRLPAEDGGEPRESERKDSEVILGENGYPQGFDDQLIGATVGDSREFTLSWGLPSSGTEEPATEQPEGTPGGEEGAEQSEKPEPQAEQRTATFAIIVKDIKRKEVPEFDDEFAKSLGSHDTLEDLKTDIRRRLYAEALRAARTNTENKAVDAAIGKASYELPERLIEMETDALAQERERALAQQGIVLERYLSIIGTSREDWRQEMRQQAERQVKARVLLDELAEREEVTVLPEEIQQEIEATILSYGEQAAQVRRALATDQARQRVQNSLRRHKAIQKLVEYAGGYPVDEMGLFTPQAQIAEEAEDVAAGEAAEPTPVTGVASAAAAGEEQSSEPDTASRT